VDGFASVVEQEAPKVAVTHQLGDDKHIRVLSRTDAVELDDVRVVERRQHPSLLQERVLMLCVSLASLHCDLFACLQATCTAKSTSSVAATFGRHSILPPDFNPDL